MQQAVLNWVIVYFDLMPPIQLEMEADIAVDTLYPGVLSQSG